MRHNALLQRPRKALLLRLEVGGELRVAPVDRESPTVIALVQAERQFFGVVGGLALRQRDGGEVGGRVVDRAEHTAFLLKTSVHLSPASFRAQMLYLPLGTVT